MKVNDLQAKSPVTPVVVPETDYHPPYRKPETAFVRFWRKLGGGSLTFAIFFHVALLIIGAFIVFRTIREPEKTVDFMPGNGGGGGGSGEMQKKARMARNTASMSTKRVFVQGESVVALPDPSDTFGEMSSLNSLSGGGGMGGGSGMGRGGGNGNGVGPGSGNGTGAGGFGTGTTFFNNAVKGNRIAYVIDFSLTMKGKREELTRLELAKSLRQLTPQMKYQVIFFSGPVWIAGDEVDMDLGNRNATVNHQGVKYVWERTGESSKWDSKGKKPKADWLLAGSDAVSNTIAQVEHTKVVFGTHWAAPLEIALEMDPPPDVVFFMTDGASLSTSMKDIEQITRRARSRRTVINSMAMMTPEAEDLMKALARNTKGTYSIIDATGTGRVVPLE